MRAGFSLLAALGLTVTTVGASAALAQSMAADEPAAISDQGSGADRGTQGPVPVPAVAGARLASTEYRFTRGQVLLQQTGPNETAVTVTVYGLEPGSEHVNHIHRGSCAGDILFPLQPLMADKSGVARSVSSVPAAINLETWWVNVHAGYALPSPGITCGQVEGPPAPAGVGRPSPAPPAPESR